MSTRVFLADDHKLFREGLKELVNKEPSLRVIGEAGDGQTAIRMLRDLNPDIVIMDISMPDLNGIEATRQILSMNPDIKILALSMHSDRRFVSEMLRAGAKGYLIKEAAADELALAIKTVCRNLTYLSPDIAGDIVEDHVRHNTAPEESSAYAVLSNREREVLQLLGEGNSTKDTAAKLFVSVKTVETHRRNIMRKLNAFSIAELTKHAILDGLTELEQ